MRSAAPGGIPNGTVLLHHLLARRHLLRLNCFNLGTKYAIYSYKYIFINLNAFSVFLVIISRALEILSRFLVFQFSRPDPSNRGCEVVSFQFSLEFKDNTLSYCPLDTSFKSLKSFLNVQYLFIRFVYSIIQQMSIIVIFTCVFRTFST